MSRMINSHVFLMGKVFKQDLMKALPANSGQFKVINTVNNAFNPRFLSQHQKTCYLPTFPMVVRYKWLYFS